MTHYNQKSKRVKSSLGVGVKIQGDHIPNIQIPQAINRVQAQLLDQEVHHQFYLHAFLIFLENKRRISNKSMLVLKDYILLECHQSTKEFWIFRNKRNSMSKINRISKKISSLTTKNKSVLKKQSKKRQVKRNYKVLDKLKRMINQEKLILKTT